MDLATVDHLLTTTRSVRKRLDFSKPVDLAVVGRCVEIAFQAPTGSNAQGWSFVVVTDADKRRGLAELYRKAFELYANNPDLRPTFGDDDLRMKQLPRVVESAMYLAGHMHEAPVLVIPCIEGRVENAGTLAQASVYGSILPAAWSFMLALRASGLATAWTTLHIMFEQDAAKILGLPEHVTQTALFPVAHYTGTDFKPAKRIPSAQLVHWNSWGTHRG
jgi:nitroreductase